jgi:glutamate formiminotransferase/formiminotetrahydrofolate cyclodeaminase
MGAFLNVKINAAGYYDADFVKEVLEKGEKIQKTAQKMESDILGIVNSKIHTS